MQQGATAPIQGHDYNTGKPCTKCPSQSGLGVHHYACRDCGADCTSGKPAGPATTDTRGVTRCWQCQEDWSRERNAIAPWTIEELDTIRVALSRIADDGDPLVITDAQRKLATEILARHEAI